VRPSGDQAGSTSIRLRFGFVTDARLFVASETILIVASVVLPKGPQSSAKAIRFASGDHVGSYERAPLGPSRRNLCVFGQKA